MTFARKTLQRLIKWKHRTILMNIQYETVLLVSNLIVLRQKPMMEERLETN